MTKAGYFLIIIMVTLTGCATVSTKMAPANDYRAAALTQEIGPVSLFSSDSTVLSDDEISRILDYRYTLQNQNRIGILSLGRQPWSGWSDELDQSNSAVQSRLVSKLQSSIVVYDASYLPNLLIPEKKTVGHFREAGARYQADLLLIYQASFQTYEKYAFMSPDKLKSYCTIEALLLDTRTGIVPFVTTHSRDFSTEKINLDFSFGEAMRRAELTALGYVLEDLGQAVVDFLDTPNR